MFLLVLGIIFAIEYCGIDHIYLSDPTPIEIEAGECTDPGVSNLIINDLNEGNVCPNDKLQCCARGYSNTSEYLNITFVWYNNTTGAMDLLDLNHTFINEPTDNETRDGWNYTDELCSPNLITSSSVRNNFVCAVQSSYEDEFGLQESPILMEDITVEDCSHSRKYLDIIWVSVSCNTTDPYNLKAEWELLVKDNNRNNEAGVEIEVDGEDVSGETNEEGKIYFSTSLYPNTYDFEATKSEFDSDYESYTITESNITEFCDSCDLKDLDYNIYYPCAEINCSTKTTESNCNSETMCEWIDEECINICEGCSTGVYLDDVTVKVRVFEKDTIIPAQGISFSISHPDFGETDREEVVTYTCNTDINGECNVTIPHIPNKNATSMPTLPDDDFIISSEPFTFNFHDTTSCNYKDSSGLFYNGCLPAVGICANTNETCDPTKDCHMGLDVYDPDCCCSDWCHPDDLICVECFEQNISCTNTSQCCAGLDCYGGKCDCAVPGVDLCRSDLRCCGDYTCNTTDGLCIPCIPERETGCIDTSDCCEDLDCIDGVCVRGCIPTLPCNSSSDCCGGTCDDGRCYGCVGPGCEEEDEDDNGLIPNNQNETNETSIFWLWEDNPLFGEDSEGFFNFNFSLRHGCTGLFIVIDNWIFCDLLWLVLIILSLIAAYRYKEYALKKKTSIITFILPMAIGFLTYVWIGIIIAILEIILSIISPPKKEKQKGDKK
jgi:hypothetical protein